MKFQVGEGGPEVRVFTSFTFFQTTLHNESRQLAAYLPLFLHSERVNTSDKIELKI